MLAGFPKFFVDFLVLGVCGHFLTVSNVGAGAGAGAGTGAGPSAAGASSTISAISVFSSFLSEKYRIRHRRSIWCCHVDKVRWKFIDRIVPDKVSFIIISKWGLKLSFFCFCESAVFLSWLLNLC